MRDFTDYYSVLGICPDSRPDTIKTAYRELVKKCHPDLHPDDIAATVKMQAINEAYLILSDREARALYDIEYKQYFESKRRQSQHKQTKSEPNTYYYHSDVLADWISKARKQAKDITSQAVRDTGGIIKEAGKGLANGLLKAIGWIFLFSFLFMLRQGCK